MKQPFRFLFLLFCFLPHISPGQCVPDFFEGFESGSYIPTWALGPSLTPSVVTTSPAAGTYCLMGTGGSGHLEGLYTVLPSPVTPTEMSWDMKPSGTVALNYVVAGNNAVTATTCMVFCYWRGATNSIRFVSGTSLDYPATTGVWYHIELKNINYIAHTFDIYINGALWQTAFPFRSATVNNIQRIHLYNFENGTAYWDNITLGRAGVPILTSDSLVTPLCHGDSTAEVNLTATGGTGPLTYAWSTGDTTEDLAGLAAGTYYLTITDSTGCTEEDTVVISEPDTLSASSVTDDIVCNGGADGAISLTMSGGTPGYTFDWSTGDTTEDISGLGGGPVYVTITDLNGCEITDSFMITDPPLFMISDSSADALCAGDSSGYVGVSASGGWGGYSYSWSNGATSASQMVPAGAYSVTVTDSLGCEATSFFNITAPPPITSSAVITDEVDGVSLGAIDLTPVGGTPPYTFFWNTFATTEDITFLMSGTFTVTITDSLGCSVTDTYFVDLITGTLPAASNIPVEIFPNPFQTTYEVRFTSPFSGEAMWELYDMRGVRVVAEKHTVYAGVWSRWESSAALPAGVYYYRFSGAGIHASGKLVAE